MKKLIFIVFLASLVNMASCQSSGGPHGTIKQNISVNDFDNKLSAGNVQLIDVRTPEEYAQGHLKNAVNLNYNSDDFEKQIAKLDKTRPVMLYCLSGGRSGKAAGKMEDMGFAEVYNMDGGIMKWNSAGKPLENGSVTAKQDGMTVADLNKMTAGTKYVLVDYNATWCEPCKKMLPVLEALAEKKKDKLALIKVNADDHKQLMKEKGISSIPYLELYKDGKLIWSHNGLIEEDELLKETGL